MTGKTQQRHHEGTIYAPSMEYRLDVCLSASYARCTMTKFDLSQFVTAVITNMNKSYTYIHTVNLHFLSSSSMAVMRVLAVLDISLYFVTVILFNFSRRT